MSEPVAPGRPPLLSFCIATFNRAPFLDETLRALVADAGAEDVEIVVLDGGSPDDTEGVLRRHQAAFPRLRYRLQAEKGGVDQDFDAAVAMASGEYVWLMSDDDLIKPGTIRRVLDTVRRGPSLVVVNAEVRGPDFSELLVERRLPFREDRTYRPDEFERLFRETADFLSFIGCVVIRRDLWLSRERARYFGTVFIHVGVIFQAPLPGDAIAIADPLVVIRFGNAQWTPKMFEIWMFKWPRLLWSFPGLPEGAKRAVSPAEPWRSLPVLMLYRAKGAYTVEEYRRLIAPANRSRAARIAARLVAVMPGALLNLLGVLCLSTVYRKYRLHLVDLEASRFHYRSLLGR